MISSNLRLDEDLLMCFINSLVIVYHIVYIVYHIVLVVFIVLYLILILIVVIVNVNKYYDCFVFGFVSSH